MNPLDIRPMTEATGQKITFFKRKQTHDLRLEIQKPPDDYGKNIEH